MRKENTRDREKARGLHIFFFALSHLSPPSINHMINVDFVVDLRFVTKSHDALLSFYHQTSNHHIHRRITVSPSTLWQVFQLLLFSFIVNFIFYDSNIFVATTAIGRLFIYLFILIHI
jgi:hypothetical protein